MVHYKSNVGSMDRMFVRSLSFVASNAIVWFSRSNNAFVALLTPRDPSPILKDVRAPSIYLSPYARIMLKLLTRQSTPQTDGSK